MTGAILTVPQVAAVTALVAGVMTCAFGLVANYPFAIATGLGLNTLVAVTIVPQVTWPEAMGLVVIDGLIIVLLVATGFRTAVCNAVPAKMHCTLQPCCLPTPILSSCMPACHGSGTSAASQWTTN